MINKIFCWDTYIKLLQVMPVNLVKPGSELRVHKRSTQFSTQYDILIIYRYRIE